MHLDLKKNGPHFQRRKMYLSNPRNNLVSTVDMTWQKSLNNQELNNNIELRKSHQKYTLNEKYKHKINFQIEQDMKQNKSTFRVLPAPQLIKHNSFNQSPKHFFNQPQTHRPSPQKINHPVSKQQNLGLGNSLQNQLIQYNNSKTISYDNEQSPIFQRKKKSSQISEQSVAKSIFGFEIDHTRYREQSYLGKILGDRLQPYLSNKSGSNLIKHQTFTINQPVTINY